MGMDSEVTDGAGEVPQSMTAVVQRAYGDSEVLVTGRIAVPTPGAKEVLVRVQAAGLDRGVWHLMAGRPLLVRPFTGLRRPRRQVPGLDLAGTVVAVGDRVTEFAVGDAVYGVGQGSCAEYAVAAAVKLAPKPAGLSYTQAAAVPVSALTALQGLHDVGRVAAGQRVLITGASGGVGTFAVQIAVASGAEVMGVCSAAKADLVRSLGAAHTIDYAAGDITAGPRRYDLVLDLAGNNSLGRMRRVLTPRGTLVVAGGEGGGDITGGIGRQLRALLLSPFTRQRLTMLISAEKGADIRRLTELIDAGNVAPALDRTFPLAGAAAAMRHLESGAVRGKVVITM